MSDLSLLLKQKAPPEVVTDRAEIISEQMKANKLRAEKILRSILADTHLELPVVVAGKKEVR
jgi:hypothetical protein